MTGFAKGLLDVTTGIPSMINDVHKIFGTNAPWYEKLGAGADLLVNAGSDALMLTGAGELLKGGSILEHLGADELEHLGADALAECGVGLSFSAATRVATSLGERAIGSLHPGDKVWAYNPKTHKMELEPILHVWINHDNDLVDLTLTTTTATQHGKAAMKTSEVIHTNKRHPFLTVEKGFVTVGQLQVGMHMLRASGGVGVVTGWKLVPGVMTMYNLEVAQDHTFTVGDGQWVVHNCNFNYDTKMAKDMIKRGWTDTRIQEAMDKPSLEIQWRDTRHNPITGVANDDPATAFYHQNGGYVVRNDVTKQIVQVSDINDPGWVAPWDPSTR